MTLVGFKVISIFKCKGRYRSCVLRQILDNTIDSEFSLPLGEFYMFRVHLMYTPCSKLPNCHISTKHSKWQLRLNYVCFVLCCSTHSYCAHAILIPVRVAMASNQHENLSQTQLWWGRSCHYCFLEMDQPAECVNNHCQWWCLSWRSWRMCVSIFL